MATITTTDIWTGMTSDRRIFGGFIESGFGRQVSGMWSEMLFNRAFKEVPPYTEPTWSWLGLEEHMYNSNAPFWHSGYEEHDWETVGDVTLHRTLGTLTFKGLTTLIVENPCAGATAGLLQHGIYLEAGREYHLELFAGRSGQEGEAGLNGFGDTIHSDDALPLNVRLGEFACEAPLTTVCRKYEWTFTAEHTGCVSLELTFDWAGEIILVCASLMPTDNLDGWRADVVKLMREASPSVVRFPGGCFVSFYDWERSVGDRDARAPMPSYYWGGLEENDVGLDEFMRLAELVGFEPQICFNMMSSTPFKARQLVEYLNAPENVGMGRLRALNGHPQPYGVRLFEMDNEPGRKWTARQYCEQCTEFAREMRLADPYIELMFAAYAYPPELLGDMLEVVGSDIQYVIYRQGDPEFVRRMLPVIREYNAQHGAALKLVNTEWLPPCTSIEPFDDPEIPTDFRWRGEIMNDYRKVFSIQQISWNYALNGAQRLLEYLGYGGEFALANFNNMCNTWGQNLIEAYREGSELSNMGKIFALFRRNFKPCTACETRVDDARIYAQRLRDEASDVLYVINHSSAPLAVKLPQGEWACCDGLSAPDRLAPRAAAVCYANVKDGVLELPALSVVCLRQS